MTIARDEIFGPVLCVIPIGRSGGDRHCQRYRVRPERDGAGRRCDRARRVAQQIVSGRVLVNTLAHEPKAPFGGFKHSGVGREMGEWGIRAFMEPRSILAKTCPVALRLPGLQAP
jgi:aldehyde dehydrogenase (NAD+)